MNDREEAIVEEFRSNQGRVSGRFANMPLLLLHTKDAHSATERITPLVYQRLDSGYAVFGLYTDGPRTPMWLHNLMADPQAKIEVGTSTIAVSALIAQHAERNQIWDQQKTEVRAFADYDARTDHITPVIILEPDGRN